MIKTTSKDLKILSHLRRDGRMSLTNISKRTNIPISTLFDKIKGSSVITRHTALLDFYRLGYGTRASVLLKVEKPQKKEIQKYLSICPQINSIFRVNNGYDFMIEGIFREILDMEQFMDNLESRFKIIDSKTHFIIEDLKREGFLCEEYK